MAELSWLVEQSRAGGLEAFTELVRRFQDMAHGYAYSILGDFHLAEDTAQEAFVDAYFRLEALRNPAAFPGWFRRIVFKHCDRAIRRRGAPTAPLEDAMHVAQPNPERSELQERVLDAIRSLPEHQREATTLFYINGHSQNEIADFLEVPVTTVKKRLHDSRKKLKERMLGMIENTLKNNKLGDEFVDAVIEEIRNPSSPHIEEMEKLFEEVFAQDCVGEIRRDEAGKWVYAATEGRPYFREIVEGRMHPGEATRPQVFALLREDEVLGVLQVFFINWRDGLLAWVDLLGVCKSLRGKGLIPKLLDRAVSATRAAAEKLCLPACGIVFLAGANDQEATDSFVGIGGQLRDDLLYKLSPEDENSFRIVWYPISDVFADVATKDLAWELWQFGGLPEEKFIELYGPVA